MAVNVSRENPFPSFELNEHQGIQLQHKSNELVANAVSKDLETDNGWKLASSKKHFRETGIKTYYRKMESGMEVKCTGTIRMSLHQTMKALYSDNTSDFRNKMSLLLFGYLDAAVLTTIRRRSVSGPYQYLGVHWIAMKSPGVFGKKRDFCYLRSLGMTRDASNTEIGFLVLNSINISQCPLLLDSLGLVRLNMSTVVLFREQPDQRTTSIQLYGTMPLSSKILRLIHTNFTTCVLNLHVKKEQELGSKPSTKHCCYCLKKFSILRTRYQCMNCHEWLCRDCLVRRKIKRNGSQDKMVQTWTYCQVCFEMELRQYPQVGMTTTSSSFTKTKTLTEIELELNRKVPTSTRIMLHSPDNTESSHDGSCLSIPRIQSFSLKQETPLSNDQSVSIDTKQHDQFNDDVPSVSPTRWVNNTMESVHSQVSRGHNSESDSREYYVNRLFEMSCKARETLDTVKQTSSMIHDERDGNHPIDDLRASLSEQADMLNVLGLMSTGRIYMEDDEFGVRMSESSTIDEFDRFEEMH